MISTLIAAFCLLAVNEYGCQQRLIECINYENELKYEESMWMDVPTEEGSIESMNTCIKIRGIGHFIS